MAENENSQNEELDMDDHHADKPSYDDVNTPVIIMVGVISALLTFLTVALVQGIYNHWSAAYIEERKLNVVDERRNALVEKQQSMLQANDQGRISIDDAMNKTLEKFRN